MSSLLATENGVALERVNYFPRQLITADDLTAEQEYFRTKLRRHNRFLHGWGVVCGLTVTPAPTAASPWRVQIDEGYALGPFGDEIYVAESIFLDLARCGPGAATDPCEPDRLHPGDSAAGGTLYVAIRYAECVARPVRIHPAGCGCDEEACEYSRIRDSFQLECLTELPLSPPTPSVCDLINEERVVPCLPCPTEPWVVLAQVNLASSSTDLTERSIDNMVRRQIYSTTVLQEQLIACCCTPPEPKPVKVVSIQPNGVTFTSYTEAEAFDPPLPSSIVIEFDKRLQKLTVNTDSIQVNVSEVEERLGNLVDGNVLYEGTTRSAKFTPAASFDEGLRSSQTTRLFYTVTVRGDGPNAIHDVDDLRLDGDDDDSEGGNRIGRFTLAVGLI